VISQEPLQKSIYTCNKSHKQASNKSKYYLISSSVPPNKLLLKVSYDYFPSKRRVSCWGTTIFPNCCLGIHSPHICTAMSNWNKKVLERAKRFQRRNSRQTSEPLYTHRGIYIRYTLTARKRHPFASLHRGSCCH